MCDDFVVLRRVCCSCYEKKSNADIVVKDDKYICENCNKNSIKYLFLNSEKTEIIKNFSNRNIHTKDVPEHFKKLCYKGEECVSDKCRFAHNEYEYFVWILMSDRGVYDVETLFNQDCSRFVRYRKVQKSLINHKINDENIFQSFKAVPKAMNLPVDKLEQQIIEKEERKKTRFCYFCCCNILSEKEILNHLKGKNHKFMYNCDKKRSWYFKLPITNERMERCKQNDGCDSPHTIEECQEMNARVHFRKFFQKYDYVRPPNKISNWPNTVKICIPKFHHNLSWYNKPLDSVIKLEYLCSTFKLISVFLRDDESRPFFSLFPCNSNQFIERGSQSQMLIFGEDTLQSKTVVFGLRFSPCYNSSYSQRLEFEFQPIFSDRRIFCHKLIRADVGDDKSLNSLSEMFNKFQLKNRNLNPTATLPFLSDRLSPTLYFSERLLSNVFKVHSDSDWMQNDVKNYNYCDQMQKWLLLEELEQRNILTNTCIKGDVIISNSIMSPTGTRYPTPGYLFGTFTYTDKEKMILREYIQKHVNKGFMIVNQNEEILHEVELIDDFAYDIETRTLESFSFCISAKSVIFLQLRNESVLPSTSLVFQFNRIPFERRYCNLNLMPNCDALNYYPLSCPIVERVPYGEDLKSVHFNSLLTDKISNGFCNGDRHKLSDEQSKLPIRILRQVLKNEVMLPFILNGAFGTGKSRILSVTVAHILRQKSNLRILICTRSFSAAIVFYNNLMLDVDETGREAIKLVYSDDRRSDRIQTRNNTYIHNSKVESNIKDNKDRVLITTLDNASSFSVLLAKMPKPLFHYIFVDEAAQVLEIDAITVYALGTETTKYVFAGDVYQTRPVVYNKDLTKFRIPIISRLFSLYKTCPDFNVTLVQVFRTHKYIVQFLSEAFYSNKLTASFVNKPEWLTKVDSVMSFVDYKIKNPGVKANYQQPFQSYDNIFEVKLIYKALEKFSNILGNGFRTEDVLICAPTYAQIKLIRNQMKSPKFSRICIDLPSNTQGKEFKAVFISTVLTEELDGSDMRQLGPTFHSSWTLMNSIISRACCFVQVIGDKNSLLTCPIKSKWDIYLNMADIIEFD